MSNPRLSFISAVEERLAGVLPAEQIEATVNTIMFVMDKYEITERTTEIVVLDDENTKLLNRYCACLLVDGKSQKTIRYYRRNLQKVADFLGRDFTEMTAYDIRYYLACEKQRGLSNSTLETTRACMSAFFQWMTNEEIIQKNPVLTIKPIKCPKEIRKPLTDVEIDALRGACKNAKERAIIEMLLSTGVRIMELAQMKVSDVDFASLTVQVRHGKGDKDRVTYTTKVAAMHVTKYLNSRKAVSEMLFVNIDKNAMTTDGFRHILKTIAKRAGVENVHPHRFRRTFASGLAARGMDIQKIQRLLGHSDINTTMKYITVADTQVKASYDQYIA